MIFLHELQLYLIDTLEHPLGVYLEKESLYFNVTLSKCHTFFTSLIMPFQSACCCYTHFPVDVMTHDFHLLHWNYNDDSDLSSFIIPDDSIDKVTPF